MSFGATVYRLRQGAAVVFSASLAVLAATATPSLADDDDDNKPSFQQNMIRSLLGGGNARPDINYRERSPLVIPPGRELPQPGARNSAQGNPAWPRDPDQQAARSGANAPRSAQAAAEREARSLSPAEMRRGARAGASVNRGPVRNSDDNEMGRALRPNEMGVSPVWSWSAFGGRAETPQTQASPTKEPARTRMTQPPAGYRMPSGGQPYQPPKGSGIFSFPSFYDHGTQNR